MKKGIIFLVFCLSILFTPLFVNADGVPGTSCPTGDGRDGKWDSTGKVCVATSILPNCGQVDPNTKKLKECGWLDLLQLVKNIMSFLLIISASIAAIVFMWAGVVYLTSAGNASKMSQAKAMFGGVALGFIFVLGAWLIVSFIERELLGDKVNDYSLLQQVGQ